MMAERSMQRIGFLFLNINNRIGKQNSVCIAHIALYVRIFQQFNSNAIQMAYRIFCLMYFLKDYLVTYIIRFLERGFPLEDRSYYNFLFVLSYTIVRKIS